MDLNWNLCDSNRNLKVSALFVCFCIFLEFTYIVRTNSNNVKVNKDIKNKIGLSKIKPFIGGKKVLLFVKCI